MKMDPFKLEGAALDWAVTACEGLDIESTGPVWGMWGWASDWGQGGPIIEREGISVHRKDKGSWFAFYDRNGIPQDVISWGNPTSTD